MEIEIDYDALIDFAGDDGFEAVEPLYYWSDCHLSEFYQNFIKLTAAIDMRCKNWYHYSVLSPSHCIVHDHFDKVSFLHDAQKEYLLTMSHDDLRKYIAKTEIDAETKRVRDL